MPDPEQPRKLLPAKLYDKLFSGNHNPTAVLSEWLTMAQEPKANKALKQAVDDLEQLATTISWRDLISPITLRPVSDENYPPHIHYLVRTGERRWWAHVWLILHDRLIGDEAKSPETVRALVEEGDANIRADQWVENQARTDFSVVENASGIDAVRAEMSLGKPKLVKWSVVENRLGISPNYRLRVMGVFKLSDEVRGLIAEHSLAERAIRPLVDKLNKQPELQLIALQKLLEWREKGEDSGNTRLTKYIEQLFKPQATPSTAVVAHTRGTGPTNWVTQFEQSVSKVIHSLDKQGVPEASSMLASNDNSLQAVRALRDRLNEILEDASDA